MSGLSATTQTIQDQDRHFLRPWADVTGREAEPHTILQSAGGVHVTDSDGNRLIDGPGGMWCVNAGYGREEIVEAAAAQMRQMTYMSPWTMAASVTAQLADRLAGLAPGDLNNVFFTTGGSTAVDSALRFAFFYNNCLGRPNKKQVIARVNGYHGATYLASSVSGKMVEKDNMDMMTDRVHLLSCPKPGARPAGQSVEAFCDEKVAELEAKIDALGADNVAAFIAEPVMASGGVIVQPDDYFRRCAEVCRKHDILFIADEVVTAFGRLGHLFASEDAFGVQPDMLTTAKGLTSGYVPMGALFISDRLMQDIRNHGNDARYFTAGFTYSGHPVAAAAAMANLDIFEREDLCGRVRGLAPYFRDAIAPLADLPVVSEVRCIGLMAGIECCLDPAHPDEARDMDFAYRVDEICQENGLLVRPIYQSCVMSPPLSISRAEVDEMARILRHGLQTAAAEAAA